MEIDKLDRAEHIKKLKKKLNEKRFIHSIGVEYTAACLAMAHGAEDATIDPEAAARFAERFHIEETVFEGEGHSLCNDPATPDKVADLAIRLFLS